MDVYLSFISVLSLVIAAVASQRLATGIVQRVGAKKGPRHDLFSRPLAGAMLFAILFVTLWFAVSFLLMIPWLVWHLR